MTQFCPHCGKQARPGDRCCVGCGQEISGTAQPEPGADPFRGPDDPRRRTGGFLVAHAKGLMALAVVAAVVVAMVLGGSFSTESSPASDDAVAPSLRAPTNPAPAPSEPAPRTPTPKRKPRGFTGANGKRYMCSFSVLDRVDTAKKRFRGRERVLNGMEAALKKLDKKYPGRTAPPASADRYNALLARTRVQLNWTNAAIGRYNQTLRDACHKA